MGCSDLNRTVEGYDPDVGVMEFPQNTGKEGSPMGAYWEGLSLSGRAPVLCAGPKSVPNVRAGRTLEGCCQPVTGNTAFGGLSH